MPKFKPYWCTVCLFLNDRGTCTTPALHYAMCMFNRLQPQSVHKVLFNLKHLPSTPILVYPKWQKVLVVTASHLFVWCGIRRRRIISHDKHWWKTMKNGLKKPSQVINNKNSVPLIKSKTVVAYCSSYVNVVLLVTCAFYQK